MRDGLIVGLAVLAACSFGACRRSAPVSPATPVNNTRPIIPKMDRALPQVDIRPSFVDVAKIVGIDFTFFNDEVKERFFLPEVMGGGAVWLDYDLDGWLDLYLVNGARLDAPNLDQPEHPSHLYRNSSGKFDQVATEAGADRCGGFGQGCCVGDFDADGFPDIYICNYGRDRLLKNNGDGTFQDLTDSAGVGDDLWGSSPTMLDLNGDDLLDIFVTNYLLVTFANHKVCEYNGQPGYCGPGAHDAAPDFAYLNNGDGTFTEAADRLGLSAPNGKGLAIAVVDFDDDAIPEIYVANDMAENFLYRRINDGSGARYENVAGASGVSVLGDGSLAASMGLSCDDFDGDGLVDIFVTNFYSRGNLLFRNLGGLLFADDRRRTRVAATSFQNLGFGTVAFDYDRDGARDLFVANGHVLGPLHNPNEMHPQLLHNDGEGRFDDVTSLAGPYFGERWLGRGAAGGDYDHDGDLDLVVTHLHKPVVLLRNETQTKHHFIGIDLQRPNRLRPLGGRVVVTAGEKKIMVPIVGGGSYLCEGDRRLLVGLGNWTEPVDVEVYWPGGQIDRFAALQSDRYWRIMEGAEPEESRLPAVSGATDSGS